MKNKDNLILITGSAGFIGAAVTKKLIENGNSVIGIDNLNTYYDLNLKKKKTAKYRSFSWAIWGGMDI